MRITAGGAWPRLSLSAFSAACLLPGAPGNPAAFEFLGGTPFAPIRATETGSSVPGQSGTTTGGSVTGGVGGLIDPCSETQTRKFIRIAMRNTTPDYLHYFLIMIAYVSGDAYPDGAVCEDDIQLYTQNGYTFVREGSSTELGSLCIEGPALFYFHRQGQFRGASGTGGSSLASAIGPAQGASPTYDNFFTASGRQLPVPNVILFHNPGTGEGRALKISTSDPSPCNPSATSIFDSPCQQDSFYYVDQDDRLTGSTALGFGSGRRVPDEIQGTGCSCGVSNEPWAELAASNVTAADINSSGGNSCNLFLRGGRIDFAFMREDTDPPFPQLVWQVTDASGTRAQEFDSRSGL